jgi:hypothetical protein
VLTPLVNPILWYWNILQAVIALKIIFVSQCIVIYNYNKVRGAFWDAVPFSLIEVDQRFRSVIALKMEVVGTSEMSVTSSETTRRNVPLNDSSPLWRRLLLSLNRPLTSAS